MSAAELFAGAGQKAGIEVWRIEALKPIRNKEAESGRLCTGDSYIVLHSIPVKSGGFDYNLHFWLGEESSQDEKGCAVREALRRFGSGARCTPRAAPLSPARSREAMPSAYVRRARGPARPSQRRCAGCSEGGGRSLPAERRVVPARTWR
jgi:hypothetical protein